MPTDKDFHVDRNGPIKCRLNSRLVARSIICWIHDASIFSITLQCLNLSYPEGLAGFVPPADASNLLLNFKMLKQLVVKNDFNVNKNLEQFRSLFSQNFEILQPVEFYTIRFHNGLVNKDGANRGSFSIDSRYTQRHS